MSRPHLIADRADATSAFLINDALETEFNYFALGAEVRDVDGFRLAWMPGLASIPAGAVVTHIDPAMIAHAGGGWLDSAERSFADVGATMARIYCRGRDVQADQLLAAADYTMREELVFAGSLLDDQSDLSLQPIKRPSDWQRKLLFHCQAQSSPDGHVNAAEQWVALERRKMAAGMDCYLAESGGEIVAAIGAVWGQRVLRFKNLVVHPQYRRESIGSSVLRKLAELGRQRGIRDQVAFAVRGEAGEALYRSLGMTVIGSHFEWSKTLGRTRIR